ncbi:hypothetical protein GCM10009731_66650 [Streptomyces globosus]
MPKAVTGHAFGGLGPSPEAAPGVAQRPSRPHASFLIEPRPASWGGEAPPVTACVSGSLGGRLPTSVVGCEAAQLASRCPAADGWPPVKGGHLVVRGALGRWRPDAEPTVRT